jgi:cellobiose phosphorylase
MNLNNNKAGWYFTRNDGSFALENPDMTSCLYFPLANDAGMMSSITPSLGGDIKSGQNAFLMTPVSQEDLHNSKSTRNFWIWTKKHGAWSVTGNSALQMSRKFSNYETETVKLEAGFLWHKIIRDNYYFQLSAEITNFVPVNSDKIELMRIKITNTGSSDLEFTPTAAIPVYGRSADNLRDHRHVTSLLNRIYTQPDGIIVRPVLSFDERGHKKNNVSYYVLGSDGDGNKPVSFFPSLEEFIGEGGGLDWPEAVVKNLNGTPASGMLEGYEAIGAMRFEKKLLKPGESTVYIIAMGICDLEEDIERSFNYYCNEAAFQSNLKKNLDFWKGKLEKLSFRSSDPDYDQWLKWVTVQPILRRIYGCSFLPHHDYGRGGRGWRDLWQDCLALLVMEPAEVRGLLLGNFAGVRIDGSNATIIGSGQGEFIADRNNISRVWMDHGAWPFLTVMLYINQTGDLKFLLERQTYFKDMHIARSNKIDLAWKPADGNILKDTYGRVYCGTILEHILLQNIIPFFNVGRNNNIRLEGADWNDALDMAADSGESVAFSSLYSSNLMQLSELILKLKSELGICKIELAKEAIVLLDTVTEGIDYNSTEAKQALLNSFYDISGGNISGEKIWVDSEIIAADLEKKAEWLTVHIREKEWLQNSEGFSWFNGYYDNNSNRVEGDHPSGVRMTLTGQVFAVMGGIATPDQVKNIISSVNKYLKDPVTGYRLNTNFCELRPDLGRAFGFAFGHKENGAMFSHMTVMYANALYKRGFVFEGFDVLDSIYRLCNDFEKSRIYPGIPEYINQKGRGMYHYLTGAASWLLITLLQEVYGVKGYYGKLILEPKLLKRQFSSEGLAAVDTVFADRMLKIEYKNNQFKEYGEYQIKNICINGCTTAWGCNGAGAVIPERYLEVLDEKKTHLIEVELG